MGSERPIPLFPPPAPLKGAGGKKGRGWHDFLSAGVNAWASEKARHQYVYRIRCGGTIGCAALRYVILFVADFNTYPRRQRGICNPLPGLRFGLASAS